MPKKKYSINWENEEPVSFEVDGVLYENRVVQDYYFPVVEYVSMDGRRHLVQMTEGSSRPPHEMGDEVTVLYNPEHPLDARVQSFGGSLLMWIWPGINRILGAAFLVAVLAVRKLMSPGEINELAQDDPRNIHPR